MAYSPTKMLTKKSTFESDPTPDEIRQRAAEIRRSWSPEVRRQREMPLPGWQLLPLILGGRRMQALPVLAVDRSHRGR
jgi:hypothetical protein